MSERKHEARDQQPDETFCLRFGYPCRRSGRHAQTGTNAAAPRALTLQACLQQALAHNFDVQVERYDPQIALNNVHAAYAGYDPSLNSFRHAQLQCVAEQC